MNNAAKLKPVTGEDCEYLEVYNRFHTPYRERENTESSERENSQKERAERTHRDLTHTENAQRETENAYAHTQRTERGRCSPTVTLVTVTGLTSFRCARRHGVSGVTTLNFIIINFRPHTHQKHARTHTQTTRAYTTQSNV